MSDSKRTRVSNEQLLAASLSVNDKLDKLITLMLADKMAAQVEPTAVQPAVKLNATPVKVNAVPDKITPSPTGNGKGSVATLPVINPTTVTGYNEKATNYVIRQAEVWAKDRGVKVAVIMGMSATGKLYARFSQLSSKAPTNALGIVKVVG